MVDQIRNRIEPAARLWRDDMRKLYLGGEVNVVAFLSAQRDYQDTVKQYLDTVVRHRRAMLSLNTVLGYARVAVRSRQQTSGRASTRESRGRPECEVVGQFQRRVQAIKLLTTDASFVPPSVKL